MQARDLVQQQFGGLSSSALQVVVRAEDGLATGRGAQVVREATALLQADDRLSTIVPPHARRPAAPSTLPRPSLARQPASPTKYCTSCT